MDTVKVRVKPAGLHNAKAAAGHVADAPREWAAQQGGFIIIMDQEVRIDDGTLCRAGARMVARASQLEPFEDEQDLVKSDGGTTSYYSLPAGATELNDLIEAKQMPFALGNIFKACYRLGEKDGADIEYDLNKIIYFAERLKGMARKGLL